MRGERGVEGLRAPGEHRLQERGRQLARGLLDPLGTRVDAPVGEDVVLAEVEDREPLRRGRHRLVQRDPVLRDRRQRCNEEGSSCKTTDKIAVAHEDRPYFDRLISYITRSPLVALVLEGEDAINRVREINGNTNPAEAGEGTIRKLYGIDNSLNSVHASDSLDSAEREIKLWF